MNEKRNKMTPVVGIIFEQEGKVLLSKRKNTGIHDGYYDIPAGHVEEAESPSEAAIREVYEEIGVTVLPEDLEFVSVQHRKKRDETGDRIDFFFKANKWQGQPSICEPEKCEDLAFVPLSEYFGKITPHVENVLKQYAASKSYIEL